MVWGQGRLGNLGPYPKGANGWRQWDPTCPFSDKFALCLHLFAFAMELNDNNGTPVFLGAPGSAKVRRSQLAFIRRIEGRSRKGDEHLLKVGTDIKWDSTCDKKLSEIFYAIAQGTILHHHKKIFYVPFAHSDRCPRYLRQPHPRSPR